MGTTSIADALFTRGQQRVLAVLFGNPGRSFYANEIIARAGGGTGAVQRELARLESAGLVTVTRVGKQKHYQANPDAPVYEELRGLVLKTTGLADALRETLAPLASEVRAAFVFGSVAKREDGAASDIDLFLVSEALTYGDLFARLQDVTRRLGRPVNPTIHSPGELADLVRGGNAFVTRVLDGPKIWLLGGPDALPTR
jgi:predicted nucleotidyltransferase